MSTEPSIHERVADLSESGRPPVVCVVSLGCAKNTVDSERIMAALVQNGFWIAEDPRDSDICLVNTCGFIEPAREETAATLERIARWRRQGRPCCLVAMGCMVERLHTVPEWKSFLRAADVLVGFDAYLRLPELCRQWLRAVASFSSFSAAVENPRGQPGLPSGFSHQPRLLTGLPHSTWLKVAEGCSHSCSFCSIPLIRGPQMSRPLPEILHEAESLVRSGVKEICVIAQDTTAYGHDLGLPAGAAELIRQLSRLRGDLWFRLLYAHPRHLTPQVLDAMEADSRWCRYLDLPLQHISDPMLRAMGRGLGREDTLRLLSDIRTRWPDVALRTTLIVGHPGETEQDFAQLCELVQTGWFLHLGVFVYSEEPRTRASRMGPKVPRELAEERRRELMEIQREVSARTLASWVGRTLEVLVDDRAPRGHLPKEIRWVGRHKGQAPEVDGVTWLDPNGHYVEPGQVVTAEITSSSDYDLIGKVVAAGAARPPRAP